MLRTALALLLCLAPALVAQNEPPRVGVGSTERKLSLNEAIQMAIKGNLEVEIERTNEPLAEASLKESRGFYDPKFSWMPSIRTASTPTSSTLAAADGKQVEHDFVQNFSFSQQVPWQGISLNASWQNSRVSSNNPFTSLNPLVNSALNISFALPLWRNRETDAARTEIRVLSRNIELSDLDFELKVIDVVTRTEVAYWNLVAARQNAQVKKDGVDLGQEQLARTKRMIGSGTLAPVELAASEAELERRLDDWYAAVGSVTTSENALKTLIAGGRGDTVWSDIIVPSQNVQLSTASEDLKEAIDTAITRRRELRELKLRQDTNNVQKELAENQTKPRIDLIAGYTSSGLGGTLLNTENPFAQSTQVLVDNLNKLLIASGMDPVSVSMGGGGVPPALIGGAGTALSSVLTGDFSTYQAGLSFDLNFRNRAAEGRLGQAVANERRLKLQEAQAEQLIEAQVRNALQSLSSAKQRITAAEAAERSGREKLDSEIRLFHTGESTNFLVLTRQNEYLDSRYRSVAATLEYNKSVAQLEQALGTTLESHEISLR